MDLVLLKRRRASVGTSVLQRVLALFGVGDVGAFYLPGVGSLQNAAGEIVESAVGDPVGFQLDLSQGAGFSGGTFTGLGTEEVTNGGFDTTSAWTTSAQCSIAGGVANIVSSDGSFQQVIQSKSLTGGKFYLLTFDVTRLTAGRISFAFTGGGVNLGNVAEAVGPVSVVFFVSTTATSSLSFFRSGVTDASIDNVSIKEIPGNHAYQEVTAARPTLASSAGNVSLSFDGVDDWMEVTTGGLLGETWTHVGAWNSTPGLRLFATSQLFQGAPRQFNSDLQWYNSAGSFESIASGDAGVTHVYSIEQLSTVSLRGRANGVAGATIIPADDTGSGMQGLALASQGTGARANGMAGDFYGGLWISRSLALSDIELQEALFAGKSGVTL